MNSTDQQTLPGLPAPDTASAREGSPFSLSHIDRGILRTSAAVAVASSLSDALMVCGPSFSGGSLEARAVALLRFLAVNLDVHVMDDMPLFLDLVLIRDRLDAFLAGE